MSGINSTFGGCYPLVSEYIIRQTICQYNNLYYKYLAKQNISPSFVAIAQKRGCIRKNNCSELGALVIKRPDMFCQALLSGGFYYGFYIDDREVVGVCESKKKAFDSLPQGCVQDRFTALWIMKKVHKVLVTSKI